MTTGMNLWDAGVWSFVLTLSLLFAAMIAANVLRRVCPFIRKALIPSSVLGGFLLLLASERHRPLGLPPPALFDRHTRNSHIPRSRSRLCRARAAQHREENGRPLPHGRV